MDLSLVGTIWMNPVCSVSGWVVLSFSGKDGKTIQSHGDAADKEVEREEKRNEENEKW
ncbi:hypothetical protein ACLOJK_026836 [Asimina triloba]